MVVGGALIGSAQADDLIMPYACTVEDGAPSLARSADTTYRIIGTRDQVPFSLCRAETSGDCETMMIHKFIIECSGQRMSWSRVAASARALGVDVPSYLPKGYAPVGSLSGRFVLPSLAAASKPDVQVSTQDLIPFTAVDSREPRAVVTPADWITVVDSAAQASDRTGDTFRLAGTLSGLLLLVFGLGVSAARRWPMSHDWAWRGFHGAPATLGRAVQLISSAWWQICAAFGRSYESWRKASETEGHDTAYMGTLALLQVRIEDTDMAISALPDGLLIRDVLQSEISDLQRRAGDLGRRAAKLQAERVAAAIRAFFRDLDRIARVAASAAGHSTSEQQTAARQDHEVPRTPDDAYQVLGLNSEAPPVAIKKVVDALRMTWHPDLARDEVDRRRREVRIKQINAAWDLLKDVSRQAA